MDLDHGMRRDGTGATGRVKRGVMPRVRALACTLVGGSALIAGCVSDPEPVWTPYTGSKEPLARPSANASVRSGDPYVISRSAWTFEASTGQVIETPTYRVLTTVRPGLLLDRLPAFMEGAIAAYTREFGVLPMPREKLETYVMATRPQWARLTQSLMRERAELYLRIQRGGYAAEGRGVYFDIGLQDTLAIAGHEGWHQYTQTTFAERLPIWLEEGIAAYMEGYRWETMQNRAVFMGWANVERYDALRNAREQGRLMPLETLLVTEPGQMLDRTGSGSGDALTYYAQVWALVHWLREGDGGRYRAGLEQMLADGAAGRMGGTVRGRAGAASMMDRRLRSMAAFQAYFGEDLSVASARYRMFVDQITRTGAKDQIVAGRSPVIR